MWAATRIRGVCVSGPVSGPPRNNNHDREACGQLDSRGTRLQGCTEERGQSGSGGPLTRAVGKEEGGGGGEEARPATTGRVEACATNRLVLQVTLKVTGWLLLARPWLTKRVN